MAALAVLVAAPAAAQAPATPSVDVTAQPTTPAKPKSHRHKVPNLEMDLGDGGETAERAGPTTTDNALTTSPLSGSTGASASFIEAPPPELPQPPSTVPDQAPVIVGAPRN